MTPEEREDEDRRRQFKVSPAWIAVALSVLTGFYQAAVVSSRVSENTRRIETLESADRQRGDSLSRIDARTARIEVTLDIMRGGVGRPLSTPLPSPDQPGATP